ncbi:MAG: N-acetylglucosamine-6-phosphate deacetylase [Pseudomonadota bacterium]
MSKTHYRGASIFDGRELHEGAALVVEDGHVVGVEPDDPVRRGVIKEMLPGGVIAPGFVDLQVNGGDGIMLNDAPERESIARICAAHARLGTTALLPTLITANKQTMLAALQAVRAAAGDRIPGFAGLHLEGPHLDPQRCGVHDPDVIRPMEPEDLHMLVEAATDLPALMVTLAPEAVTPHQIRALAQAGVIVSLGHSNTNAAVAKAAFAAGASCVTHLFNAMSPLGHREPGLVGAGLTEDVYCGLIADGLHVLPEVLRIALAAKRAPEKLFLVTDAMAPAGTELASFELDGQTVRRKDGCLMRGDGTLSGADLDMLGAIRVMVEDVGIEMSRALAMATFVPGGLIDPSGSTGRLVPGSIADFVHLGDELELLGVWQRGKRLV